MSIRPTSVLVLDDADVPVLDVAGLDVAVHRAHGLLQAAALLAHARPRWLVLNPKRAWHRRVLAAIPRELRPAVVGVGDGTDELVDAWWSTSTPLPVALEHAARAAATRLRSTLGAADFLAG